MTRYYISLSLLLLISSCSNTESGCSSVDECLSTYDFEGARKFIDDGYDFEKGEKIKKITISESKYWADKGEIDRALTVIDESWGVSDYAWKESDWQEWRFNIIDKGVTSCCEKGDYRQAKVFALKASDDMNLAGQKLGEKIDGWVDKKGNFYSYESDCEEKGGKPCLEAKAKGPSMRESLLKKISQFEELLK
jgi:hypothetical protein